MCFKLRLKEALRLWLSLLAPYSLIYYVQAGVYFPREYICLKGGHVLYCFPLNHYDY
jgi:hypothetical protein